MRLLQRKPFSLFVLDVLQSSCQQQKTKVTSLSGDISAELGDHISFNATMPYGFIEIYLSNSVTDLFFVTPEDWRLGLLILVLQSFSFMSFSKADRMLLLCSCLLTP